MRGPLAFFTLTSGVKPYKNGAKMKDEIASNDGGLDDARRRVDNRYSAIFLVAFLVLCAAFALVRLSFYIWVIELVCGVVYVAIFMFAFSMRDYSPDRSFLYSGVGFLFTFVFDIAYCYTAVVSGSPDFRLEPRISFLWICTQWFQAFTFLMVLSRGRPKMTLAPVTSICAIVGLGLLSLHFFLPGAELTLVTTHRGAYFAFSAIALTAFYGAMLWMAARKRRELPAYFVVRTMAAIVASGLSFLGLLLTMDSGPAPAFAFYFLRFVGLALCYNANVTFILLSPFHALYGQLSSRAAEMAAANARLGAALAEKEVLLGEVHHRVKNNLQVVSSLLSLQAGQSRNLEFKEAFEESQRRIRAMALVHEMLYQDRNFAAIDFSDYLKRIMGELLSSSGRSSIKAIVDCEAIEIPIDAAITCSLIVNELVTNSLKHAFPGGRAGLVSLRMRVAGPKVELTIEDDGVGLPPGFDLESLRSMGFSLVTGLVSQLRGECAIEGGGGTRVRISFPREGPARAAASGPLPPTSSPA